MPLLRVAQVLLGIACCISIYLGYTALSSAQLAGCGTGSDCDTVLTSRWAYWFGLPVSVPAAGFYMLLLAASLFAGPRSTMALQRRTWNILIAGAFVVLAAALWFVGLQAVILKSWCKFCMGAHLLGGIGAVLILMSAPFIIRKGDHAPYVFGVAQRAWPAMLGMLALVPIVVGQYFSEPPSATVVLTDNVAAAVATPATNAAPQSANGTTTTAEPVEQEPTRLFTLHDKFTFNLHSVPLIGDPDAPYVMVSLFDYTCSHCRTMHERLIRVQNQYTNELAIVAMPMPLDSTCNPLLTRTQTDHVNACQYARIALSVFKEKEEKFHDFENWLFETERPRPINEVYARAKDLSGVNDLDAVINHPGVEAWIKLGIEVFKINHQKSQQGVLPMIMAGNAIMAGDIASDQALVDFLATNLGLPRKTE